MSDTLRHVALLVAMRAEASPIISALDLAPTTEPWDSRLPIRLFQGQVDGLTVSLIIAGVDERYDVDYVGCEPAALMAYEAIRSLEPQLLISVGTAGGFAAKGADIGTVYLSADQFVYHDRHVPMPGFDASGVGHYPAVPVPRMAAALGFPTGVVSSGSSLEKSNKDIQVIASHDAVAKEMEVASIAWVGMLLDVPVMAVKSITNLVDLDNESEVEFVRHFERAAQALCDATREVVHYLAGRSLSDL